MTDLDDAIRRLKHRRIYEVFLWGGLAHASSHKKIYDEWAKTGKLPLLQMIFVHTLAVLVQAIDWFRVASLQALPILQEKKEHRSTRELQRLKTDQNASLGRARKTRKIHTRDLVNDGEGTYPAIYYLAQNFCPVFKKPKGRDGLAPRLGSG